MDDEPVARDAFEARTERLRDAPARAVVRNRHDFHAGETELLKAEQLAVRPKLRRGTP